MHAVNAYAVYSESTGTYFFLDWLLGKRHIIMMKLTKNNVVFCVLDNNIHKNFE